VGRTEVYFGLGAIFAGIGTTVIVAKAQLSPAIWYRWILTNPLIVPAMFGLSGVFLFLALRQWQHFRKYFWIVCAKLVPPLVSAPAAGDVQRPLLLLKHTQKRPMPPESLMVQAALLAGDLFAILVETGYGLEDPTAILRTGLEDDPPNGEIQKRVSKHFRERLNDIKVDLTHYGFGEYCSRLTSTLDSASELRALVRSLQGIVKELSRRYTLRGNANAAPADTVIPDSAPLVVPVRYGKLDANNDQSAVFITNDGVDVAFDIKIDPATFAVWTLQFSEIHRLAKGDVLPSILSIHGLGVTFDLDWAFKQWSHQESRLGAEDEQPFIFEPRLDLRITYRDQADRWYTSVCEIGKDMLTARDSGVYVKWINRKRMASPIYNSNSDPPGDAPSVIVECRTDGSWENLVFRNEKPKMAIKVRVVSMVTREPNGATFTHTLSTIPTPLQLVSNTGPVECRLIAMDGRTGSGMPLSSILSVGTDQTVDTARIEYDDSDGTGYYREFALTRQTTGDIFWDPGPVRLREKA